jgi:hypothetical protein
MAAFVAIGHVFAADSTALLERGATRDQVIAAFGPPVGSAKAGTKEIIHYRNGSVTLANGRVERINLKPAAAPAPPPPASPPTPAATAAAAPNEAKSPLADVWISRFDDATRDASRRSAPILALFTSSDASPASRQFQKEIALHPEFVNAFRGRYDLLNVDFPVRTEVSPDILQQNEAWRDQFGVRGYPALLILDATGVKIAEVAIADSAPGSAFRGRLLAAVDAAHPLPEPTRSTPVPITVVEPAPAPTSTLHVAPTQVTSGLTTARWLIAGALIAGTLVAGVMLFVLWLMLRKLNKPVALTRRSSMASRIDQAASGLPSHAEILAWPREKLCHVVSGLAEREGYVVEAPRRGSEKDLILKRPGNPVPEAIVSCVTGGAGVIPTRKIREMVGILAADDVPEGWFISPAGFSMDARAYAEQHKVRLIDGARLLEQLGDLPTFALPKILALAR